MRNIETNGLVDLRMYIGNVQDINGLISQEAMVDKQGYRDVLNNDKPV